MGRGLSLQDALTLEADEQMRFRHRRTRKAIHDTYKSEWGSDSTVPGRGRVSDKPFTKKRRKLPNGRKWKNKQKQYAALEGQMVAAEFNSTQKVQKVLRRHYAERAEAKKNRLLQ